MTVNTERQDYKIYAPTWQKCRDIIEGQEQMHRQGEIYLPKLTGQTNDEYNSYVARTLFYNATQRTVDALKGLLFRKNPIINVPNGITNWLEDIDMNGNSLNSFVEDIAYEVITVGRYGLLVEHPTVQTNDENSELTQAEAERNNIRPFFAKYTSENIINWKTTVIQNQKQLSMVVLREYYEELENEFETTICEQYRVLDLFQGFYRQRLFRLNSDQKTFSEISSVFPLKNGLKMNFIPFIMLSTKGISYDIEKPPIIDLVNVNLSHYKTTADLEHGSHFTGLPTAVVTGHSLGEGETLKIGSSTAWVFAEADAEAKYLEFTGSGLDALEKRLEKKENQMATLGARMLANEKAAAETAETHTIKRQGENSALASIASSIETAIIKALRILCEWVNIQGEITYKINKDFIPTKMSSQDLLALLQAYQSGAIAFSDFIENLKKGEIIDSEKTIEEIQSEIELSGPIRVNPNEPK